MGAGCVTVENRWLGRRGTILTMIRSVKAFFLGFKQGMHETPKGFFAPLLWFVRQCRIRCRH